MTDSLGRKRKLAGKSIPCAYVLRLTEDVRFFYSTEKQFTLLRNNLVYCEKLFTPLNILYQFTILNNLLYCETIHSINLLY